MHFLTYKATPSHTLVSGQTQANKGCGLTADHDFRASYAYRLLLMLYL